MRHGLKFNHLSRQKGHRKALLAHLASDLIKNKRIITTVAKAKALRVYVEPLITKSKTNTTHQRREVFKKLQDKEAVTELFGSVSAKIGTRPGGYTRIIKLGTRYGDATEMAMIELVDFNEVYSNKKEEAKPKRRRTRRGGGGGGSKSDQSQTDNKPEQTADEGKEVEATAKKEESKPAAEEKVEAEKEEAKKEEKVEEPKAEKKAEGTEEKKSETEPAKEEEKEDPKKD